MRGGPRCDMRTLSAHGVGSGASRLQVVDRSLDFAAQNLDERLKWLIATAARSRFQLRRRHTDRRSLHACAGTLQRVSRALNTLDVASAQRLLDARKRAAAVRDETGCEFALQVAVTFRENLERHPIDWVGDRVGN